MCYYYKNLYSKQPTVQRLIKSVFEPKKSKTCNWRSQFLVKCLFYLIPWCFYCYLYFLNCNFFFFFYLTLLDFLYIFSSILVINKFAYFLNTCSILALLSFIIVVLVIRFRSHIHIYIGYELNYEAILSVMRIVSGFRNRLKNMKRQFVTGENS